MRMGVAKPQGSAVGGQKDSHHKLGNGEPPRSGFVVHSRWCFISTVQVRVGGSYNSVAEGNCVAAKRGGEQPAANGRSAGGRTRFGGMWRRACNEVAKPETHRSRWRSRQSDEWAHHVVGGGTTRRGSTGSGETWESG